MGYLDTLIQQCYIAKTAIPVQEFIFSTLDDLPKISKAIYIIEQVEGDINETFNRFRVFKEQATHACAKLNVPCKVMYVGSSTTGIKNRLKQHLGQGHKATYALHLNQWFQGQFKITIKQYDVENQVLQLIEDDLSDQLKPAFGKLGANNK
ncbi:MAG: hypothetical protein ACN6NJ_13565 [Acinetobacter sp.]|jgi:hypothetical protein